MFEYHGWATIRDSAGCEDEAEEDPAKATIASLQQSIRTFDGWSNLTVDLRVANGAWHIWIAGFHNHRQNDVITFFESVARTAPGSFGVLYVLDDEADEDSNQWICWVMSRGSVRREVDRYLSPHIGVVEDDCSDAY